MSETCSVALGARKLLRTFLVIALLVLQVILAVGGRYTKCPVDGAVAAEEPANSADTNALLGTVSLLPVDRAVADVLLDKARLLRLRGRIQPGMKICFLLENLLEGRAKGQEMAHRTNG